MQIERVTVVLGTVEYEIESAPFARSKKWRPRLASEIKPLFDQIAGVQSMTFERPEDLLSLWPVIQLILVDGIEIIFEMLIAYSPALESKRAEIEETATDKQVMSAFTEVLKLADPFGLFQRLGRRSGLMGIGTSLRSQSVNGDSPTETLNASQSMTDSGS